jgi:rhamnosyl/mannosyltransferase
MRVLEIATDAPPYKGGISRLVGVLVEGLRKNGVHVDVKVPKRRIGEFKPTVTALKKYEGYDVIHIHGPTPFLSDVALLMNDNPIIYTHHAEVNWLSENLSYLYRRFHRFLACKKAQIIVIHSHEYAGLFKRAHVEVIRPPVTFQSPKNFQPHMRVKRPFTVIYVGQFRAFKGIDVLIKTASILKDVQFILVGEGSLKPKFRRLVNHLHLKNTVFEDSVDDRKLQALYELSHVICLPSINTTEAYGLVLIEGASHGCVPIASNLIGVRENLRLLGGLTFSCGSHKELANLIRELKVDSEKWLRLSTQTHKLANEYIEKYNPEYYVQRHMELFQSITQHR